MVRSIFLESESLDLLSFLWARGKLVKEKLCFCSTFISEETYIFQPVGILNINSFSKTFERNVPWTIITMWMIPDSQRSLYEMLVNRLFLSSLTKLFSLTWPTDFLFYSWAYNLSAFLVWDYVVTRFLFTCNSPHVHAI